MLPFIQGSIIHSDESKIDLLDVQNRLSMLIACEGDGEPWSLATRNKVTSCVCFQGTRDMQGMGQGGNWEVQGSQQDNFQTLSAADLPWSLFLGAKLWKNFLLHNFLNIYLEGFIPVGFLWVLIFFFFFPKDALTSVFGKMCYFLSICIDDFYFATEPVLLWIVQLLVLRRNKAIFSRQPTWHLIQLEHVATVTQKTKLALQQIHHCMTSVVKAGWRGCLKSPVQGLPCYKLKVVCVQRCCFYFGRKVCIVERCFFPLAAHSSCSTVSRQTS